MRISDWSSYVCSSDLRGLGDRVNALPQTRLQAIDAGDVDDHATAIGLHLLRGQRRQFEVTPQIDLHGLVDHRHRGLGDRRSEEHTSELQSLMRISYAVFCLKKKKKNIHRYYEQE